jgi:hypothetical protein
LVFIFGGSMKKFSTVVEITMPDDKAKEIESWGEDITPISYIDSIIADHVKDRGLQIKLQTIEVITPVFTRLTESQTHLANQDALEDLEEEILLGKACINGNCED